MKINIFLIFLIFISSCTTKKDVLYFQNISHQNTIKINEWNRPFLIQSGDVLDIEVLSTLFPEAAKPYNKIKNPNVSVEMLPFYGYSVDDNYTINFPGLGKINVKNLTIDQLEVLLENELIEKNHLKDASVSIKCLNSKVTILGEVNKPGTYRFLEEEINILQAIGYAGDLNTFAKKSNVIVMRDYNGVIKSKKLDLTKVDFVKSQYYKVRNNDLIVVEPNYNKIKSSGFIGSPQSIASIASLLLSITLLIINK